MASEEHLKLSTEIKSVHKLLRDKSKKYGAKHAWSEHLKSKPKLKSYAVAMKELATNHWEPNDQKVILQNTHRWKTDQQRSRITWTVNYCREYFQQTETFTAMRDRELRLLEELNLDASTMELSSRNTEDKTKLLDVGSCYNPFGKFDDFDVTAIDIAPAVDDVIECDFLNVDVTHEPDTMNCDHKMTALHENSYDAIVFSLLLEYLPASEQRICCCEKAYRLLKREGILIIITPDSKHVGANAKLMKTWRYTMALMGFNRVKYEKLEHITCMVFRKCVDIEIGKRWARIHKEPYMEYKIEIPQDFTQDSSDDDGAERTENV